MTVARLASALSERYRIERELGAGGMATVYLAEDVRHRRKVALKLLHPELSAVLGPDRFLKEIELTASLQHPHILPLFDSGSVDGQLFYVMPYVEGQTLRARLDREGQLSVGDATRIAREVADALQYAHERGIIHRDIKPENILLQGGHALVSDFGIALAVQQAGGQRMTQTGLSLGTPQYMAPEQAMGDKAVDARADVYALGVVTYEMLAGEPPFTGPNAQAIVARVLTEKPRTLVEQRDTVPSPVNVAVLTALQKLPADRYATAAEFAAALADVHGERGGPLADRRSISPAMLKTRRTIITLSAVCLVATVAAIAGWLRRAERVEQPVVRFSIMLADLKAEGDSGSARSQPEGAARTPGTYGPSLAVAPNGQRVAFVGPSPIERQIYVRALDDPTPRALDGTEGAYQPVFAPNGMSLAFAVGDLIRRIDIASGRIASICTLPGGAEQIDGMSWGDDDSLLVIQGRRNQALRVAASGGVPRAMRLERDTTAAGRPVLMFWPDVLPGSEYAVVNVNDGDVKLQLLSLKTGHRTDLMAGNVFARYAHPAQLIVQNEDLSVSVVPFNLSAGRITGTPTVILPGVEQTTGNVGQFTVGRSGVFAYMPGGSPRRTIVSLDRKGSSEVLIARPGAYEGAKFSPDGSRIVLVERVGTRADLWLYDVARATKTKLTFESDNFFPMWSPDGRQIAFTSRRIVPAGIFVMSVDGGAAPRAVVNTSILSFTGSFSADGRTLYYRRTDPTSRFDIFAVDVDDSAHVERPVLQTRFNESAPMVSPNGRLLAYVSDETGPNEIYVRRLDGTDHRWLVTSDGGMEPLWSRDGRELFFRRGFDVFAVPVDGDSTPRFGNAVKLFSGPARPSARSTTFDVSPDGKRFLMISDNGAGGRIEVMTDWHALLRARTNEQR